jgi:hypothetical protein
MSVLKNRVRALELAISQRSANQGMTPAQCALDMATIHNSEACWPDGSPEQAILHARIDRLTAAVETSDESGLLPGDLDVLLPSEQHERDRKAALELN